jgi:hypothetical protein
VAFPGCTAQQHLESRIERRIGEVGKRRGRLRRAPATFDFGDGGQ